MENNAFQEFLNLCKSDASFLEAAKNCATIEEAIELAKQKGFDFDPSDMKKLADSAVHELQDEELLQAVGGVSGPGSKLQTIQSFILETTCGCTSPNDTKTDTICVYWYCA